MKVKGGLHKIANSVIEMTAWREFHSTSCLLSKDQLEHRNHPYSIRVKEV